MLNELTYLGKIMKKKELIKALEKEKKKNSKGKAVKAWCCPGCGVDHEPYECMDYQKAKNKYWAIKRYYSAKA